VSEEFELEARLGEGSAEEDGLGEPEPDWKSFACSEVDNPLACVLMAYQPPLIQLSFPLNPARSNFDSKLATPDCPSLSEVDSASIARMVSQAFHAAN
jgi:hypothetical protein